MGRDMKIPPSPRRRSLADSNATLRHVAPRKAWPLVCRWARMTLPSGTRLGPYEVVALLGARGMGEVYRARDTRRRHDRR